MLEKPNTWALVLAAGEGSRLRSLTTPPSGTPVPKQFCSLFAGPSLLDEALCRAQSVAAGARTCVVVAEHHRRWWQGALRALPAQNVIVQPSNRGTAIGILLPLLHILCRDPAAQLVLLPSDHHVREEGVLAAALCDAVEQLEWRPRETLLLGLQPDDADPDLGYILPGDSDGRGALTVARFIEKPSQSRARELIGAGGLWNAFIVASSGLALLELFRQRIPGIVDLMTAALGRGRRTESPQAQAAELTELYHTLPVVDFSRDIVAGREGDLRVLPVRPCGWSDLGTPKRVSEALRSTPRARAAARWVRSGAGCLSLAQRLQEIGAAAI